jgi:hypothetical protein
VTAAHRNLDFTERRTSDRRREKRLTHFQDDDLIAAWIGPLTQICNLRGGDCWRLIAPAIAHEGDNVGGILV